MYNEDGDNMKKSSGILVYKIDNDKIKVLLSHPGGPYWENKKTHCWSIPKGEQDNKESLLETALREFREETNLEVTNDLKLLGSTKVSNNKLVTIFYTEEDLDTSKAKSNNFELEWPPNSGIIKEFPEMDKTEWIDLEEAKELIFDNQLFFINKLESILKKEYDII